MPVLRGDQSSHRHDMGGIVIIDSDDEDAPGTSNPLRIGDPGKGCSRDGGGSGGTQGSGNDNNDDDGGDYTRFYRLVSM